MSYVRRTIIVPAAQQALARALIVAQAGESQANMLTVPLALAKPPLGAPVNETVAFVSSGPIEEQFAALLVDPAALFAAAQVLGAGVTLLQCTGLLSSSVVVDADEEPALATLARLGYVRKEVA